MQIACSHCGARYAFEAALIPPQGYDARCTSCQAVFFVHPEGAKRPAAAQEPMEAPVAQIFAPESLHRGTMELNLAPEPAATSDKPAQKADWGAKEFVAMRPGRRHEEPDVPGTRHRPFARRGLFLGVLLVAVIGSGVVVGVVCSKRLHAPPQVQPPIHIVRAPDPIAAEAFSRGLRALWDDTSDGYIAAGKAFDAATARDGEFTDAWAGAALAALWQGDDLQQQAQSALGHTVDLTRAALSEVAAAAQHASPSESDAEANPGLAQAQALREQQNQAQLLAVQTDRAVSLHNQALQMQRHGASLLLHSNRLTTQTPLMAVATAMWYVADSRSQALVPEQLRAFDQLTGNGEAVGPTSEDGLVPEHAPQQPTHTPLQASASPFAPLGLWAQARLWAQDKAHQEAEVVEAYEAALKLQPGLRRARFELALYQLQQGHPDVARPLLEDLAHGQPAHEKARAVLDALRRGRMANPAQP